MVAMTCCNTPCRKSFDLGQFERFRRIMHIPAYKVLLNHEQVQTLSTLKVSDRCWKSRVHVVGEYGKDEGVYEFTLVQRLGGRYGELVAGRLMRCVWLH